MDVLSSKKFRGSKEAITRRAREEKEENLDPLGVDEISQLDGLIQGR